MDSEVLSDLKRLADKKKAAFFPRFFKTGPGEYGEGDVFLGVTVPQIRLVVKLHADISLSDCIRLLKNPIHECRLAALLILVDQYKKADANKKDKIAGLYLKNTKYINNWDLVDSSADKIIGAWVDETGNVGLLGELAASKDLWKQRIAMIATLHFIRKNVFDHTYRIAKLLLNHPHDLIHKATGWMLREAGKRDPKSLEAFLKKYYKTMPRTMLRYAIEKFKEPIRKKYLKGEI